MKTIISQKGYSLIEVLVAVAILMLSIVGPLTIAAKSLQSAQYARQQNTAFFLAQEGITAMNVIRNNAGLAFVNGDSTDSWSWVDDPKLASCFDPDETGCNLYFDIDEDVSLQDTVIDCATEDCTLRFDEESSGMRSVYQFSSGEATPFKRTIVLEESPTNPNAEVIVTSSVEWGSVLLGTTKTITLTTSLFDLYE